MSLNKTDSCISISQLRLVNVLFANGMSATSIIILCYVTIQNNVTFCCS